MEFDLKLQQFVDWKVYNVTPIKNKFGYRVVLINLRSNLNYGGNEGIYLDLWIEYFNKGEKCQHGLGTFKTLYEDEKAMHRMAGLLADFVVEEQVYSFIFILTLSE